MIYPLILGGEVPVKRHVSAFEARTKFGQILDAVRYRKEPCVVEKNGRPAVVIVDVEAYRALEALGKEERYVEEYSAERLKELLTSDKLSSAEARRYRKLLDKSGA